MLALLHLLYLWTLDLTQSTMFLFWSKNHHTIVVLGEWWWPITQGKIAGTVLVLSHGHPVHTAEQNYFLFQNKCHLFNSVKSTEPLEDTTSNYLEEGKVSHDSYPLGKELLRTATYIQKSKKFPKNVLTPSFDTQQNLYSLKCFSQNAVDKESLVTPFS